MLRFTPKRFLETANVGWKKKVACIMRVTLPEMAVCVNVMNVCVYSVHMYAPSAYTLQLAMVQVQQRVCKDQSLE